MTTVAIMQPYFAPYAGYFRLFAAADLFVIYDCVQFPRRGWVHRNQLPDRNGKAAWLTLPLRKARQDVLIRDLEFAVDADERFRQDLRRFPALVSPTLPAALAQPLLDFSASPLTYIVRLLESCCRLLGLSWTTLHSSALAIDEHCRGQDRILEILRAVGATRYVNSPGGRALYAPDAFRRRGVELRFLQPYAGPAQSILHRIATEPWERLSAEIGKSVALEP